MNENSTMSDKKKAVRGEFYGTSREDEEKKFRRIRELAAGKLTGTQEYINSLQSQLKQIQEVYDLDEHEGQAQWINTDARLKEMMQNLERAKRAQKKPYFGRIDIVDSQECVKETFYVGKANLGENPEKPEVIDWRAPLSSVYYDHSLGECSYRVPEVGFFSVDLQRKRTYEIDEDGLRNFYDSDVVANDDLLTKYLSQSKRTVLSEIIATIQDEQNKIIRKDPHHNMLIQGSAGSGKTTVAMHRISYVLYNYEREFKPEGFYIVGSNKVLLNYITAVLPDLDVFGVKQMTMEELLVRLLYEDWDVHKHKIRPLERNSEMTEIKSSTEWFLKLKKFAAKVERELIPNKKIVIEKNNQVIMTPQDIDREIRRNPEWSMVRKFERLNDVLTSHLENELFGRYYSYNSEEQKKIKFHFKNYFNKFIWKNSVFDLYERFIEEQKAEYPAINYIQNEPDIYDLASLAYLYKRIKETEIIQEASHVVIDEAQDFGMMVYHALMYCMSKCTFTVMGDVSQNINFSCGMADWEELKEVMLPDPFDYFGILKKSYRNTVEISHYATDILKHASFPIYPVEPIIRHGEEVAEVACADRLDAIKKLKKVLGEYAKKNYETIAVICKDQTEARELYKRMSAGMNVVLFDGEETTFGSGVTILPIEYAKGLEFDAVIIFDASKKAYPKHDSYAKLLYVAVTRALHELTVLYTGELTALISDPIPIERQTVSFVEDSFHREARVFEEEFKTKAQIAKEQAHWGDQVRDEREKYGPKHIAVSTPKPAVNVGKVKLKPAGDKKISGASSIGQPYEIARASKPKKNVSQNESEFGTMPEGTSIKPIGHGRIDNSIKWISKGKKSVQVVSANGTLCIVPVAEETVRITFFKNEPRTMFDMPEEIKASKNLKWKCLEGREYVEVVLEKLTVKISRRTGAISFISSKGQTLLSETDALPRQFHGKADIWWNFFAWGKKECIQARDTAGEKWEDIANSAKYISHGKSSTKPALIMSNMGYQIIVPGGLKTLACTVLTYGNYLCFENSPYIDYFFRAAR